jgi:dolichol kinase
VSDSAVVELLSQHVQLISQVERLWTVFIVLAFLGALLIVVILFAAVWSVRTVNRQQRELEGKFTLLIDILLEGVKRERERRERLEAHGD